MASERRVAFICGLAAEAAILRRLGFLALANGGHQAATRRSIARLREAGAEALVSFGIAGALDPGLAPGDLILGESVISSDGEGRRCDPSLLETLAHALPGSHIGQLAGRSAIAVKSSDKSLLFKQTRAMAVDQESHCVAGSGLAFAVLRAVADKAEEDLPPAVRHGLDEKGRGRPGVVLAELLADPTMLSATIRAASRAWAGLRALRAAAAALPSDWRWSGRALEPSA